ncbi:MAG: alanine--tRNA ligase [Fimbriimonadaceae bacterium]
MDVRELRQKYIAFFKSKGHAEHPSGSLVPTDVTGRLDESLLFSGAGMVQFKPYFRGVATPPSKRLITAQKCLRTGDIESVGNLSHLTFFEMLGNFSFGDYFKKEAIAYSWEFLTSPQWLALDPSRLSFTVFAEDDEAYDLWAAHISSVGIDPETRIFRLGEATNYWPAGSFSSGPPGPCGPNSEMFYWTSKAPPPEGKYKVKDYLRDEALGHWLEIWNDVFIQYEWQGALRDAARPDKGYEKSGMPPLPFQSVDTGMGLERTAAVLGGFSSVYDTDAFVPIIRAIESLSKSGDGRTPTPSPLGEGGGEGAPELKYGQIESTDVAVRIVADHLRAASFCIADGVLPSNTGRGYVLRRLIRRAVLKGVRALGFGEPFLHKAYDGVVQALGDHYFELHERRDVIKETLKNEEEQFRRTLEQGTEILGEELAKLKKKGTLSGAAAFRLYDTFGFPFEVTKEIAEEAGFVVDYEGYLAAMTEAQERSRSVSGMESVYGGVEGAEKLTDAPTNFVGYDVSVASASVLASKELSDGNTAVALDASPFYAESGGQVADTGVLIVGGAQLQVRDVQKKGGVFVHLVEASGALKPGAKVEARVDTERRKHVTRNHTATHLLHAALREALGKHVTQAGSLVAPDYLRFDFTHGQAMTQEEIERVERAVNDKVLEAQPVHIYEDVDLQDARDMGAMALFGEKYADRVRVVQIGGMKPSEPSFSRELCGGIHVRNTGEIGLFKVTSEASAASGVRRIEAVTGIGAYEWALQQRALLEEAAGLLKTTPGDLLRAIDRTMDALKEEKRKREKLAAQGGGTKAVVEMVGSVELAVERLEDADPKDAQLVADRLVDGHADRVALVVVTSDGKLTFVCKVGDGAKSKGAHAGKLIGEVAKVAGGGGGGRPDFATAGGKDPSQLEAAIARANEVLASQVM